MCSNWFEDERVDYEEEYGYDPSNIKLGYLKSHNYKDMRVLDDFLVCFFFVFLCLIVACFRLE